MGEVIQAYVEDEFIRPTVNNRGFTFKKLTQASRKFIDFAIVANKPVLDIGCAYGVATLPILAHKKAIVAFDLESEHLEVLKQEVEPDLLPYLSAVQGRFPEDMHFSDSQFSAVHMSNILHFLTGEQILQGLEKVYKVLDVRGKVFINAGTPFINFLSGRDEYERRVAQGIKWPGEMTTEFFNQQVMASIPKDARPHFVHFLTKEVLEEAVREVGFTVDECYYFQPEMPPNLFRMYGGDGRGWLSLIATK